MNREISLAFQRLLMEKGVIIDEEQTWDNKGYYIKVITSFESLIKEAENQNLYLELANGENDPLALDDTKVLGFDFRPSPWISKITRIFAILFGVNYLSRSKIPTGCFSAERLSAFKGGDVDKFGKVNVQLNFFTLAERSLLTYRVMESLRIYNYTKDGKIANVDTLVQDKVFQSFFPLHDGSYNLDANSLRFKLFKDWVESFFSDQPFEDIRTYFGEKIALYFAWIDFYTRSLVIPTIVGLVVFFFGVSQVGINIKGADSVQYMFDNVLSPFYALFIAIWSTVYLEFWKRRNSIYAYKWSTLNYEEHEPTRPQWVGTKARISAITGKYEKYFPNMTYKTRIGISSLVVLFAIGIVIVTVGANIVYRAFALKLFSNDGIKLLAPITSALLTLVTLIVLGQLYEGVAVTLTDWENHRTDTEYEDAFIAKRFVFDFVNNYSSLFYIGLFKEPAGKNILGQEGLNDECTYTSCMVDLMIQLAIIFVGKQIIGQIQESVIPWAMKRYNEYRYAKTVEDDSQAKTPWVRDDSLAKYQGLRGEYLEMALQFGFMTIFVAAFPLGPFFALVNNLWEIRLDARKMLVFTQRPIAFKSQDIGIWNKILVAISYISLITNACLIAFSSQSFKKIYLASLDGPAKTVAQILFVLIFEHVVLGIRFILVKVIPDIPLEVRQAIERENYLAGIAIYGKPEADDDIEAMHMLGVTMEDVQRSRKTR